MSYLVSPSRWSAFHSSIHNGPMDDWTMELVLRGKSVHRWHWSSVPAYFPYSLSSICVRIRNIQVPCSVQPWWTGSHCKSLPITWEHSPMCCAVGKRQLQQTVWPIVEGTFAYRKWLNWMLSTWQFRLVHRKRNGVVREQCEHVLLPRVPSSVHMLTIILLAQRIVQ